MPGVGLGVIILNEKREVLLILRNDDAVLADSDMRLEGTWTLPAGKVKTGETLIQAAIRKVKSEVDLDVSDLEVISIADDINEYAHFVTIGLIAKSFSGNVDLKDSVEHVDYGFFDLNNLPKNLCLPSKKIIDNYLENKIYRRDYMNKVVLVTGARRGLGLAIAKLFASRGYNVVINDMEDEYLLNSNKEMLESTYNIECLAFFGDISREDVVKNMLDAVDSKFHRLDCLVNNAAIVTDMELSDRSLEMFENTIRNNVSGTYLMSKYFGKYMYDTNELSRIVNISSTNGINCNFPTSIDYDASKAAVISLTHNFAIEYAPKVLVNTVAPGWIMTEMNDQLPQDLIDEENEKIYLHRFAKPEEIASFVYYLGSDENTYANNQVFVVDGGY